jgi:hypothetical protein
MEEAFGQWITDDQRFCFDFKISSKELLEVETTVYYTSLISNNRIYLWSRKLHLGKTYEINISKETDGYSLHGTLKLKLSNDYRDELITVVWANLNYQVLNAQSDFQGPIFIIDYNHDHGGNTHDNDEFHDHEEPHEQNPEPRIEPERDHDLFPYTYMRAWPSLTDQEVFFNFIETPDKALSDNEFYQKLVALKAQGNASAMIQAATEFINSDQFVQGYKELLPVVIRYPDLHHHLLHHWDQSDIVAYVVDFLNLDSVESLKEKLEDPEYMSFLNRVWLSFIAMTVCAGYKFKWLDELIKIIIINNLIGVIVNKQLTNHEVRELLNGTIILPDDIFPLPPLVASPPQANFKVLPFAIGELQIVRQRLIGYAPGEIARVINILPGEKKKVTNRTRESEKKRSATKNSNDQNERNKTVEGQEDFESEIIKTFANFSKDHNYTNLNTNYGPPYAVTIGGSKTIGKTFNNPSKKDLSEFAKKVLNTSSQSMSKKVVEWRSHSTLRETEEKNTSQFDNSKSKEPITAFYKWLNKIYEARVVNYGKRLIYSLWILNPAHEYKQSEKYNKGKSTYQPKSLSYFSITDYESITQENANLASLYYDVDIPDAPPQNKIVSVALTQAESLTLEIPDGYEATSATVTYIMPESGKYTISGAVGQKSFSADHPASNTIKLTMNGETGSIPVVITTESQILSPPVETGYIKVNIEIECQPTSYCLSKWQLLSYRTLSNSYQSLEKAYYDKYSNEILESDTNPEQSNALIKNEIKKVAFYTLSEYQSYQGTSVLNNMLSPPDDYLDQPIFYQFINTIFEWPEMTFQFYENLGSDTKSGHWIGTNNDEELLTTFLKAGAVRIMLPVDPKYSRHAILFMDTGIVWEGKDESIPSTNQNMNLMYEAKTIEPDQEEKVEDKWEVTVPTSQQIVDQYINLISNRDERI